MKESKNIKEDWVVLNIYLNSPTLFDEIIIIVNELSDKLIEESNLVGYYYNRYYYPSKTDTHLRYGFHKLHNKDDVIIRLKKLEKENRIKNFKQVEPDLKIVDGMVMDELKLTARKLTKIIKTDFNNKISVKQAVYLIHLSMNPFFSYKDELELYSSLLNSTKLALGIK